MYDASVAAAFTQREILLNALYEAAELEHNLMCTYLYAAASLKSPEGEGLSGEEAAAVRRWRQVLLSVSVEEMGHLVAVWNITSALGGAPRIGRTNFPLDPGYLPAGITVRLAPFNAPTLQHFVFLERPQDSSEPEGTGFACERPYVRGTERAHLVPQARDYQTVGEFYATLGWGLGKFVERYGAAEAFDGDPALQLTPVEVSLPGAREVRCLKTALAAFAAIVEQGEGAPRESANSHFRRFLGVRAELEALRAANPAFEPAFPAATNPVLRRPPRPEGRVWIEDAQAFATVDLANASYALMLRLLAYAYQLRGPSAQKSLVVDLAIGLMQATMPLAGRAARLPAGPSNPGCNAGMSFITLRDPSPVPPGPAAWRLFGERFEQLAQAGAQLRASADPRALSAAAALESLQRRAAHGAALAREATPAAAPTGVAVPASLPRVAAEGPAGSGGGREAVRGEQVEIQYEGKRCIHSRFCVTWTPEVFLANVKGPWIQPQAASVERVVEVAHACPSGAIRYRRLDGGPEESAPPVNLMSVREGGPYAFRAPLLIDGADEGFRATLCRCGASKNKPFCDGSHHAAAFSATGEPPTGNTDALPARDGVLAIEPQLNGPLRVSGNLEILSGTGRAVARITGANLCRCGGSANKPFCDGTHARIGFKSL